VINTISFVVNIHDFALKLYCVHCMISIVCFHAFLGVLLSYLNNSCYHIDLHFNKFWYYYTLLSRHFCLPYFSLQSKLKSVKIVMFSVTPLTLCYQVYNLTCIINNFNVFYYDSFDSFEQ